MVPKLRDRCAACGRAPIASALPRLLEAQLLAFSWCALHAGTLFEGPPRLAESGWAETELERKEVSCARGSMRGGHPRVPQRRSEARSPSDTWLTNLLIDPADTATRTKTALRWVAASRVRVSVRACMCDGSSCSTRVPLRRCRGLKACWVSGQAPKGTAGAPPLCLHIGLHISAPLAHSPLSPSIPPRHSLRHSPSPSSPAQAHTSGLDVDSRARHRPAPPSIGPNAYTYTHTDTDTHRQTQGTAHTKEIETNSPVSHTHTHTHRSLHSQTDTHRRWGLSLVEVTRGRGGAAEVRR